MSALCDPTRLASLFCRFIISSPGFPGISGPSLLGYLPNHWNQTIPERACNLMSDIAELLRLHSHRIVETQDGYQT